MIRLSRITLSSSCRETGSPESMRCRSLTPVMTRPLTATNRSPARRSGRLGGAARGDLDNLDRLVAQQVVLPHQSPRKRESPSRRFPAQGGEPGRGRSARPPPIEPWRQEWRTPILGPWR